MIVGVHSDESYIKLKHKHTIDNTEKRMNNVKKYADQVSLHVGPGTGNGANTIINLHDTVNREYFVSKIFRAINFRVK